MQKDKMRVRLYLQKGGCDKSRQAPIMGRTTFLQRYDQVVEEEKKLVGVEISKRWHSVYYMIRKHLRAFVQGRYQTNDIAKLLPCSTPTIRMNEIDCCRQ